MKKKKNNRSSKDTAMDDDDDEDDASNSSANATTTATTTARPRRTGHIKKRRGNVTIESSIIRPLANEFITYLLDDGVRLPNCATKVSSCLNDNYAATTDTTTMDDEEEEEINYDDDDNDGVNGSLRQKEYTFPELTSQIQTVINHYTTSSSSSSSGGGGCFPKLNWSSPKDASWINCGSLKCTKPGDVYLLLKCSDFITFDLEKAWDGLRHCSETDDDKDEDDDANPGTNTNDEKNNRQMLSSTTTKDQNDKKSTSSSSSSLRPIDFEYELILRKWCNLHPSMEFRCFIYKHTVIAICQRHPSKYYNHLQIMDDDNNLSSNDLDDCEDSDAGDTGIQQQQQQNQQQHPYVDIIQEFYLTYVQYKFANGKVDNYVLDIYLDTRNRVWIIDFNIWGSRTDALLYNWDELILLANQIHDVKRGDSSSNNTGDGNAGVTGCSSDVGLTSLKVIPEWKVVTKSMNSMTYDPLSSYRGPTDVINLLGGSGGSSSSINGVGGENFEEFMKQCVRPSEM